MDDKKEIVKMLQKISGKYPANVIFDDWIKCLAISIQNACTYEIDEVFEEREKQFKSIIEKYGASINEKFAEMTKFLINALTRKIEDVLGIVYMEASMGNKNVGQFFTPTQVSQIISKITASKIESNSEEIYKLYEPTSGSGGAILEIANELQIKGVNYQKCMHVIAQDLDWRCVYMTYVQLSLLGINAIVAQGDTLIEPYAPGKEYPKSRLFFTPKKMGVLDLW